MNIHSHSGARAMTLQAPTQRQADRRAEILDAAQRCFARDGFHQASMQDICAEAGMSAGNLYRYFPSKEAIIAGICERDLADAAESLTAVSNAPDFFEGLAGLARHHLVERTADEIGLCAEIMAESRRNPQIAAMSQNIQQDVRARIADMLQRAIDAGEIRSDIHAETAATVLMVLADGISWRRAVEPMFDPEAVLPMVLQMVGCLLAKPAAAGNGTEKSQ
jgi:TetR/AcrR family transcriptional regulator, repressor for uid operon